MGPLREEFLEVELRPESLDRWITRTRILEALKRELPNVTGVVLDLGCGVQPYRSLLLSPPSQAERCIGLDLPGGRYSGMDVAWDGGKVPIADASVDTVVMTEVLEHCPYPDTVIAEAARVLRPGGRIFLTVPFLWPLHDVPFDEYRFTPFALRRILLANGFGAVEIRALGGWDAGLAQMVGLWVRRRPMGGRKRALLSRLAVPLVRSLARSDRVPDEFREGTMITGLSGVAVRGAAEPREADA